MSETQDEAYSEACEEIERLKGRYVYTEIEKLRGENARLKQLITDLAAALQEANELLLYKYGAERELAVDALIQRAREAGKDET